MNKSHITYEELLQLVSYGIFAMNFKGISVKDERLNNCKPIENALHRGIYTGSPAKDIYLMLPYLNDKQIEELVCLFEDKFPKIPPGNHVNVGACIRFIYGQFEKQGILRSEKDFERMKKENLDWNKSREFIRLLYDKLEEHNNYYGMSVLCEMNAHRSGDEAVINNDKNKLNEMESLYNKSVKYALKCKSYKHMFTPYYWSFKYFDKFGDKEKAIYYAYLTMESADKNCPDARPGYVDKLTNCLGCIKKDKKMWKSFLKKYKNSKNKCVKKVLKKYGK